MGNQLHRLTVCIFTYNRPKELMRLINYWSQFKVELIILDASQQKLLLEYKANVNYCHVPYLTLSQRLIKFSSMIKTEYMLLSPDDDFFFPKGLNEIINFLDLNQDYSSAQGLRLRFYDYPSFNWLPDYLAQARLKFENSDKQLRLMEMYKSMHYIYSVIRLSNYQKIVNCLEGVNSTKRDALMMNEYVFNYTLPLLGKHLILPILYSARKAHEYLGADVNFSAWINDKTDSDATRYRNNIVKFYMDEINCKYDFANHLFNIITSDFSIHKKTKPMTKTPIKKLIKRFFFESKLRIPYFITRPKYFNFFWILFLNRKLIQGILGVNSLRIFLKRSRL